MKKLVILTTALLALLVGCNFAQEDAFSVETAPETTGETVIAAPETTAATVSKAVETEIVYEPETPATAPEPEITTVPGTTTELVISAEPGIETEETYPGDIVLPEGEEERPPAMDVHEQTAKNAVRSELECIMKEDSTLKMYIYSIDIDKEESRRIAELWTGSELAESRGWSNIDLHKNLYAIEAYYYVEYDHEKTFLDDGVTRQYFYVVKTGRAWEIADRMSPETTGTDELQKSLKFSTDKESYSVGEDISITLSNESEIGFCHDSYYSNQLKFESFENGEWVELLQNPVEQDITIPDVMCANCPRGGEYGENVCPSKNTGDCHFTFTARWLRPYYGGALPAGRYRIKVRGFFSNCPNGFFAVSNEFVVEE